MIMNNNFETYTLNENSCIHCERCTKSCDSLQDAHFDLGTLAKALHESFGQENPSVSSALTQALRSCFLCGYCVKECPAYIDVVSLMLAGRQNYQDAGFIERSAWVSVQVDQEWDIFKAYRAIYGIAYNDLDHHKDGDCKAAFFPGCSLMAYAPELTREVFSYIESFEGKTTLVDYCCGSPLKSAGFLDRAQNLAKRFVEEIQESGASIVLCCCPGCYNILEAALKKYSCDAKAMMLPSFLLEKGFKPASQEEIVPRMFVSCQDKGAQACKDIEQLFGFTNEVSELCGGCCGAGGAVSAFKPQRQAAQVEAVFSQCEDGDTLISMCPTCTYTFAFQQIAANQGEHIINKNYLELAFSSKFDWEETFKRLNEMWVGPYGEWLAQTFS